MLISAAVKWPDREKVSAWVFRMVEKVLRQKGCGEGRQPGEAASGECGGYFGI